MNVSALVFVIAAFATFFNNALHWYTQFTTYPLFNWVGQTEFSSFHHEYKRRLSFSIYIPYTLLLLSTLLLAFIRPAEVPLVHVLVLLLLNLSIMIISLVWAVPIHQRLQQKGSSDKNGIRRLIGYNTIRLIVSSASSLLMANLMIRLLYS